MATSKFYFSFAIADSMFPEKCDVHRQPIEALVAKTLLDNKTVDVACNPSHAATIDAMKVRHNITVEIPTVAPIVKLQPGDQVLVMSVRGLPRLDATRHEYTVDEIAAATFSFGLWTVMPSYQMVA